MDAVVAGEEARGVVGVTGVVVKLVLDGSVKSAEGGAHDSTSFALLLFVVSFLGSVLA